MAAGRDHWPGIVMPVMDARKKRVYTAAFRDGRRIADDIDIALDEFIGSLPEDTPILATGPDANIAADYPGVTIDPLHASGRAVLLIDMALDSYNREGPDPGDIGPVYLRLSEAEEALEKRL
jgi:tRNA threonylcarbamoyladenosine biosynthesis protein TsaB